MKQDLKAALLTAFVYPGVGHFSLKKHFIGAIFTGVFSVFLILTLHDIFAIAQCTANEIVQGKIPMSVTAILKASQQPSDVCAQLAEYKYIPLMIIIWVLSMSRCIPFGHEKYFPQKNKPN